MLILIAESKTMAPCNAAVPPESVPERLPALDRQAAELMRTLAELHPADLAKMVKISLPMAVRLHAMIYDFPNKTTGAEAIDAYTGVVFRAFGHASLTSAAAARAKRDLRIVSSLYGLLRTDDIIKPYRLDFSTAAAPGGATLARYLRPEVTELLSGAVAEGAHSDILDLMPAEAAKAIDMKTIGTISRIWRVEFKEVADGGALRTPSSNRLKTLRGMLLRDIMERDIATPHSLAGLETDTFMPGGIQPDGRTILFYV